MDEQQEKKNTKCKLHNTTSKELKALLVLSASLPEDRKTRNVSSNELPAPSANNKILSETQFLFLDIKNATATVQILRFNAFI